MANEITNWTEYYNGLKKKIFQSIEDGSWKTLSVSNTDGTSQSYQSMDELMKYLQEVEAKAVDEEQAAIRSPYRPVLLNMRSSRR